MTNLLHKNDKFVILIFHNKYPTIPPQTSMQFATRAQNSLAFRLWGIIISLYSGSSIQKCEQVIRLVCLIFLW